MREPKRSVLWAVAEKHLPKGWKIIEYTPGKDGKYYCTEEKVRVYGVTFFEEKEIHTVSIVSRFALGVFLHECGHANLGHARDPDFGNLTQTEYEAEQYAIAALRADGIPVPKEMLSSAKLYIRNCLAKETDFEHSDAILKFAYGKDWRAFK